MKKTRSQRGPRGTGGQPSRRPRSPGAGWAARPPHRSPASVDQPMQPLQIEALSHDGRGIGRVDGKACFVRGALPGEQVSWRRESSQRNFDQGSVVEVLVPSPQRQPPGCEYYPRCGGCSLRHLDAGAALAYKQQNFIADIERAGLSVEQWLAPLQGGSDGYRRRARLAVQKTRDGRVELGFRNAASRRIEPLQHCRVLTPLLSALLGELPSLLAAIALGVVEVELTESDGAEPVLLVALSAAPGELLNDSGAARLESAGATIAAALSLSPAQLQLWWRDHGERDFRPLGAASTAHIALSQQLLLACRPGQFLQVNGAVNRAMVEQVLALAGGGELAVDLFAGVGNFSLPLARRYRRVIAVEGLPELVASGAANAAANGIDNIEFHCADLNRPLPKTLLDAPHRERIDLLLIDPPRSGAAAAMDWIGATQAKQILYISCHPATLLRDAGQLLAAGYRWRRAVALDMFPHTAHLEALALFERD